MHHFTKVSPGNPLREKIKHTRTDQFLWEEQSIDRDDNPYDYTGHTFKLEIKKRPDGTPVVTMDNDSFEITQSEDGADAGVNDMFIINHPPDDFADLIAEPFEYYFDIQIWDAKNQPFTPIVGTFVIEGD